MTKTTLSEETQELLDEVYDVELAHEFIENHGEDYFLTYYEKYEELVREYDQNLIDEFAEHYDIDTIEHFDEMYQGQYDSGAEFAENICEELGYIRDLPPWVAVDWEKTWENALSHDYTEIDCDCSDYTYGHIFSNNY